MANIQPAVIVPPAVPAAVPPAVPAAGVPPVVVPPVGPVFALMPARVNQAGIIDYNTRTGQQIYVRNTRCFYSDKSNLFNAKSEGLQGFLNHCTQRIREADWATIFQVPEDNINVLGPSRFFMVSYGTFDLEHLTIFATTYVNVPGRAAQDNFQASTAIMTSLSEEALARIHPWREQYMIGQEIAAILLLKIIIRESYIDSNATTRIARENLSSLDVQLKALGYDILKLNTFVQTQLDVLLSRGETTQDLLANLFKAYKAAKDEPFVTFITARQAASDADEINYTPQSLMLLAAGMYKTLVATNQWNAPSKDQAKLLALATEVKDIKAQMAQKTKAPTTNNTPRNNTVPKTFPKWMTTEPNKADIASDKSKSVDGKTYWWCIHHKRYVQHHSSECKKGQPLIAADKDKEKEHEEKEKALKLASALQAAVQDDSDSEQE